MLQVSYLHTGHLTPWAHHKADWTRPLPLSSSPYTVPAVVRRALSAPDRRGVGNSDSPSTFSFFELCLQVIWERSNLKRGPKSLVTFSLCPHRGHTISMGFSDPRAAIPPAGVPAAVTTARRGPQQRDFGCSPRASQDGRLCPAHSPRGRELPRLTGVAAFQTHPLSTEP